VNRWSKARLARAAEFVALSLELQRLDPKAFERAMAKVEKLVGAKLVGAKP